jgi:hypothetical protein
MISAAAYHFDMAQIANRQVLTGFIEMGYTYLRYIRAQAVKARRTGRRSGNRLRLSNR